MSDGRLFSFNGTKIVDLTPEIAQDVPTFGSVQSVAWNGEYWLIGGVDFLATYDGYGFTDLTDKLNGVLAMRGGCCSSVNAIVWNGVEWMLGGGTPVAQTDYSHAWLVQYAFGRFTDLTPKIASPGSDEAQNSSILTIAASDTSWIIGGYSKGRGLLYQYSGAAFTNLSYLLSDFTYVNWLGAGESLGNVNPITRPYSGVPSGVSLTLQQPESPIVEIQRVKFAVTYTGRGLTRFSV